MVSWADMLKEQCGFTGDSYDKLIHTLSQEELHRQFDPGYGSLTGYGSLNGSPFLAWGENYVYFPVCCDGAEWVDSAPRNPRSEGQSHVGG